MGFSLPLAVWVELVGLQWTACDQPQLAIVSEGSDQFVLAELPEWPVAQNYRLQTLKIMKPTEWTVNYRASTREYELSK